MKNLAFSVLFLILHQGIYAQNLYFPPIQGNTWATLHPDSLHYCPHQIDSLYQYLEDTGTKAFMILKEGKIVLEKYFENHTQNSLWYWASAGKSLTAFTVGLAQQEGHLSIQDSVSRYLGLGWTAATPQQEGAIKIVHQLSMSTGLNDGVANVDCTLDTCLTYLAPPGTRWAYHNAPYTLLDQVIENATGLTLNNYIQQKIHSVTGMTGAFTQIDFNNVYFSTARSMARFGLLMLNQGAWGNTVVLSDTAYYQAMINSSQSMNPAYGYLWWLNGKSSYMLPSSNTQFSILGSFTVNAPPDMYSALGRNSQIINIVPSQNLIVIRMGDDSGLFTGSLAYQDSIWARINALNCNAVGVNENLEISWKIYPNPAQDFLNIQGSLQDVASIQIMDMQGKLIYNNSKEIQQKINVNSLAKGLYILQLKTQNGAIYYKKWMKN